MRRTRQRRAVLQTFGAAAIALAGRWSAAQGAVPDEEALQVIEDLGRLREQSRRERLPVLLFFTTPGCPFCLEVRRNYLAPRVKQGRTAGVIVREVDITSRRTVAGHDGRPVSESELAVRFNVRVAPVVVLVNGDLMPLADPLVGIDRSGFYEGFLSAAIETARAKVATQ